MSREQGQAHLDTYLAQVHRHLRALSDAEARETLAELRSHVLDRAGGQLSPAAVEAAIAALGSPRDVARLNVTERVATVMETDRSPLSVFRATGRLARLSLHGFVVFLVSLSGYGLAAAFLITAVVKPFMPAPRGAVGSPGRRSVVLARGGRPFAAGPRTPRLVDHPYRPRRGHRPGLAHLALRGLERAPHGARRAAG